MVEIIRDEIDSRRNLMVLLSEEENKFKAMIVIGFIIFLCGMVV